VMDMGTGTGILAILAVMLGAKEVEAVEIDPFAYENAVVNADLNNVKIDRIILGDAKSLAEVSGVDIFLANINRNIIISDLPAYAVTLNDGASVMLSGFYEEDIPMIVEAARPLGLEFADSMTLDRWASLHLIYNSKSREK
ncbi:MAG: 50S ribosomal protein L11 methyltransferase, partial [Duncaniella sp.]|nr:50S ribosomal protein L11 methyltransferase [Duncaniella sp.]